MQTSVARSLSVDLSLALIYQLVLPWFLVDYDVNRLHDARALQ